MELIGCSSSAHQSDSSGGSHDVSKNNLTGKEAFVNHGEIAWNQIRKEWVGDQSTKLQRPPKDSTICLTESSDDILFSKEPFRPPIPLATIVSYLLKNWHEEGLYEIGNR
ncbi:uncharacterized protein [Cicer arietinum]|uniref:Uncharacterized protein LOC101503600 n=1 Tax=Cicer arietinum TaxID=3827 RepID=A0A1S2XUY4_CICAR|nr:uncharacterized protein LOC101503600 [Cicer arietinum]XP_027188257.1 uncharacterized protein LOC101503600 [Cicer arietinum]